MYFEQVYDKTLAQASYFIGCQAKGVAIVIDPKRDVDTYLEIAKANNMRITHIAETHIHADFLSGSRELAALSGAKIYLSDEGGRDWQYEFEHIGLRNGSKINVGNLSLDVIHTPGHTPESISFLLTDHPASEHPVMLFTGDFVFVGDVGRPDLLEEVAGVVGSKDEGAKQLFDSLKKFKELPDYLQVWPGHGAGSACGKALGSVASTTVGYEKIRNWALQFGDDFEGFKKELLKDQPEAPHYFSMMKKLNKVDRDLLTEVPEHPSISVEEIASGDFVVDTRHKNRFAEGHLPNSINIQNNKSFANWMGWMANYKQPIAIVADAEEKELITRKLMRIGMDNIKGFITEIHEETLCRTNVVGLEEVEEMLADSNVTILDVRNAKEYSEGHIADAKHYFVGKMAKQLPNLPKENSVVVLCQAGDRSTIAASYLEANGFKNVYNYSGSMKDWLEHGKAVVV